DSKGQNQRSRVSSWNLVARKKYRTHQGKVALACACRRSTSPDASIRLICSGSETTITSSRNGILIRSGLNKRLIGFKRPPPFAVWAPCPKSLRELRHLPSPGAKRASSNTQ